ncbi:hypothetical protein Tco_0600795 [Tanacetum coccineum]
MDQIIKHDYVQETNNHKRKLEDKGNIINNNNYQNNYNNNDRNNDYYQQQNRRQETSKTYIATNRLRDVAVYYHFSISTFPVEIVIKSSAFILEYLLQLPIKVIEQPMAWSGMDLKMAKLLSFNLITFSLDSGTCCLLMASYGDMMFIEIFPKDDNSRKEEPEAGEQEVKYFDIFPTRSELAYHRKLDHRENANGGVSSFTGRIKRMHVFVGNFTYIMDFMIIEDISSIIDPRLSQVVLGKPFVEISNMTHEPPEGVQTKSVYLRNEKEKRRGVEYVMSKILGFYKECLELGPEYLTGMDDEGEVTLYLMRRSLEVLRKFHWMILGGQFNQLSHVSSLLLSKPGEY